jgi:hypothetical protein
MAQLLVLIWPGKKANYFWAGDWTGRNSLNGFKKLSCRRMPIGLAGTTAACRRLGSRRNLAQRHSLVLAQPTILNQSAADS